MSTYSCLQSRYYHLRWGPTTCIQCIFKCTALLLQNSKCLRANNGGRPRRGASKIRKVGPGWKAVGGSALGVDNGRSAAGKSLSDLGSRFLPTCKLPVESGAHLSLGRAERDTTALGHLYESWKPPGIRLRLAVSFPRPTEPETKNRVSENKK